MPKPSRAGSIDVKEEKGGLGRRFSSSVSSFLSRLSSKGAFGTNSDSSSANSAAPTHEVAAPIFYGKLDEGSVEDK